MASSEGLSNEYVLFIFLAAGVFPFSIEKLRAGNTFLSGFVSTPSACTQVPAVVLLRGGIIGLCWSTQMAGYGGCPQMLWRFATEEARTQQ